MRRAAGFALALGLAACGGSSGGSSDVDAPPASQDAADVAGDLDGLRWDLPCIADTSPELCTTAATVSSMATLTGTPGTTYAVTIHLRGVIEPKTYTGGTRDGYFQTDGTPAGDTANIYRLTVSAPAAVHYVNAGTTRLSSELYCETIDYTATIFADAGATVTLEAESLDELQIQNRDLNGDPLVIADVPPAPEPFDGQFIQLDVTDVDEAP